MGGPYLRYCERRAFSILRQRVTHAVRVFAPTLVCLALTGCFYVAHANQLLGRVVSVADGDTLTVLDSNKVQHKIRLAGIDAPEKAQPFGGRSKESLSELAYDKWVTVETDKQDRYGRSVGKVLVDGRDINLVQVERGMAWFYRHYQHEQSSDDRRLYDTAEVKAKLERRGLWRDADPMPPWDFRKSQRH